MRLIDADKLMSDIEHYHLSDGKFQHWVEIQPTIEPQPHWIPCSERLPEEDHWLGGSGRQFSDNVLISILNSADKDEWVDASYTIDGEWTLELSRDCKVIAWMPLPKPYQEEGEKE